jgi:predicted nucleic acid-binding protein
MTVISNSTPLVHLSAMGQLELLRQFFGEIQIPEEVYQEVVIKGQGKPGCKEVERAGWIKRVVVKDRLAVSALNNRLGIGESACLILAVETGADLLILDDRSARLEAQGLGLKTTGTIGILLSAAERGLLNFETSLNELLATGFRLSPKERERILHGWQEKRGPSGT